MDALTPGESSQLTAPGVGVLWNRGGVTLSRRVADHIMR